MATSKTIKAEKILIKLDHILCSLPIDVKKYVDKHCYIDIVEPRLNGLTDFSRWDAMSIKYKYNSSFSRVQTLVNGELSSLKRTASRLSRFNISEAGIINGYFAPIKHMNKYYTSVKNTINNYVKRSILLLMTLFR